MPSTREIAVLGFVTFAFAGGTLFMYLAFNAPKPLPEHASALPQSVQLPEFSLQDDAGDPFTRDSFGGHWSLVFFGFTHCPDICPATLQQLAIARDRFVAEGEDFPAIVLVSVDPERDTPETLSRYVAHFGPGITGVTGSLVELRKLTAALGIYFEKSGGENGNYSVDHSSLVAVINPRSEFQAVFRAPHKVDHFVADLPLIIESL